ncbi:hypothetical protein CF133_17655 [Aeromonas salmonicida]|nr:hypothetical protein CF133_17655 [Aeromonas salmonicida]
MARKVRQLQGGPVEYRCCDALQQLMSRLYRQAGIKGGSGHSEPDHVWPYLDVRPDVIRLAFMVAL